MLPPHSYFPMTSNTASFLLFSDKELKELSMSLSACPRHVNSGPSSSSRAKTMSIARSSPISVTACCSQCHTEASASIVGVIAPPSSPAISWIYTRGLSSCFIFVQKKYGRARHLNASSPYIAWRAFIFMITDAVLGAGTPTRHWASALVVCHSLVSVLPAFFKFFLEGNTDLSIASEPNPHSPRLGMRSSSLIIQGCSLFCGLATLFIRALCVLGP